MEKISLNCHTYKTEIPETDWEQTPTSVKGRMEEMKQWIPHSAPQTVTDQKSP